MEYLKLFQVLNTHKVKYFVCGGLAANIYGIPLMTAHTDSTLEFTETNLANFENTVKRLLLQKSIPILMNTFLSKEKREKAKREKNLIAFSFYSNHSGFMNLDVLLNVPIEFGVMWQYKTTKTIKETSITVVNVKHLIAIKNYANRFQDKNDVILLSKLLNK